jgi:hypothetical protein
MEVHHPHSHGGPKKWKEYVAEFLMLFLAVSMGFVAENIREKHTENERSEELMQAFVSDLKENQKQLDSLITNNKRVSNYYETLAFQHGFDDKPIDLKELAVSIDLWMYRFLNKKTIFEQMKSTGALRYIQNKDILNAMLRYEENANMAEMRSMVNETDEYNNEFRPAIAKILPLAFFKYYSDEEMKNASMMDTIVHPGRFKNLKLYRSAIRKELENTKLTKEQRENLAKAWHLRQERIWVNLRFQIELQKQGAELLELIDKENHH